MLARARWVLPVDRPPVSGGWIRIERGRVIDVAGPPAPAGARDLGDVAVLPGLVNAHTHLELGWLAGRVPPAESMTAWIRALMRERAKPPDDDGAIGRGVERGIAEARATGTVLIGDVSNTLVSAAALAARGMDAVVFHELIGFRAADPDRAVRDAWTRLDTLATKPGGASVVAHAPYSVSPSLFRAIAAAPRRAPLSVHLAESAEELEFLMTGRGPFRALLEDLGAWNTEWQAPRCGPVEYLARVGYLERGCLVVHGIHLTPAGLDRLRQAGAVIVSCPRSNEWVGGGVPPIAHFYASGVPVAIGTDSLASARSLNMFDEIAAMRRLAPEVSAASLIESATRVGAEALGRGADFGTIAPGKRASLVTVRLPAAVRDVEEYLVGGVPADDVLPLQ
jgi:cytosine/adenosine deaminase-related metal-dependent hydrolase